MSLEPTDETPGLSRVVYSTRWLTGIAVLFSLLGAVFMFLVGAVSTVKSIGTYFGGGKEDAFSDEAALKATTEIVGSLDEFLLALVLLSSATGCTGSSSARTGPRDRIGWPSTASPT